MSKLTFKHKAIMERLFNMENGYILDFSNKTFHTFMAQLTDIDVYLEPGYKEETSKAKKLRRFWDNEEEPIIGKVILSLLDIREEIILRKKVYDDEYVDKDIDKAFEIKSIALEMVGEPPFYTSNNERLNADIASANTVLLDLIKICERVSLNCTYNAKALKIVSMIFSEICCLVWDITKLRIKPDMEYQQVVKMLEKWIFY